MADYKKLKPFILRWEGGYAWHKADKGGPTNKGITIATFRYYYGKGKTFNDLKHLTDEQWDYIFLRGFWNPFKATDFISQSVADICVDWAWASGTKTAIKQVQRILGVKADGVVGNQTLCAINASNQRTLFEKVKARRIDFVEAILKRDPSQKVFLNGWKNRINSLNYTA